MSKVLVFGKNDYLPGFQNRKNNGTIKQIIDFNKNYDCYDKNNDKEDVKFDVNALIKNRLKKDPKKLVKNKTINDKGNMSFNKKTGKEQKFIFKSLNCGPTFTLLEEMNGDLFMFGENSNGIMGHMCQKKNDILPTCAKFSTIAKCRMKSFATSGEHSIIITTEGILYGWGQNKFSQLNSGSIKFYDKLTEFHPKLARSRNPEFYDKHKKEGELNSIFSLIKIPHENAKSNFLRRQSAIKKCTSVAGNQQSIALGKDVSLPANTTREREVSYNQESTVSDTKKLPIDTTSNSDVQSITNSKLKVKNGNEMSTEQNVSEQKNLEQNIKNKFPNIVTASDCYSKQGNDKDFVVGFDQNTVNTLETNRSYALPAIKTNKSIKKTHRVMNSDILNIKIDEASNQDNIGLSTSRFIKHNSKTTASPKVKNLVNSLKLNTNPKHNNTKSATNRELKHFYTANSIQDPNLKEIETSNINSFNASRVPDTANKVSFHKALTKNSNSDFEKSGFMKNSGEKFGSSSMNHIDSIIMVSCNPTNTYFVTNKGCFSIGSKEQGLLGFENTALLMNHPVPIDLDFKIQVEGVSANRKHVLLWDSNGLVFAWGSNQYCQLGVENNLLHKNKFFKKPEKVFLCLKKKVMYAMAGVESSFVVTNKGQVYYWGMPVKKLDGKGIIYEKLTKLVFPTKKNDINKVSIAKQISSEYDYGALDTVGRVYTWGTNYQDNLGFRFNADGFDPEAPNYLNHLNDYVVYDISLNQKNLVCIAFPRNQTTEKLLQLTPQTRNFYDKIRLFLKVEQNDLKTIKDEEIYQKAIQEDHPMARLVSPSHEKIGDNHSQSMISSIFAPRQDSVINKPNQSM